MENEPSRVGEPRIPEAAGNEAPTARTRLRRGVLRADYEPATVRSIVDAAPICHVAVDTTDGPLALPMAHGRIDDSLYLHGALANSLLRSALDTAMCATFTCLDGLVIARSPFHNSMNYRCAVVLGTPQLVDDEAEKLRGLRAVSEHVLPAWEHGRPPDAAELRRTMLVSLSLQEASAKVRSGDPVDEPEDLDGPWWAGTVPCETRWGSPVDSSDLAAGIAVPEGIAAVG